MRPARPPVRRLVPIWLGAVLAVGLLPSATLLGGVPPARAATEIRPRITGIQPLSHEVYGYLPYWRLDAGTVDRINYNLVSTIAFFGLGIKSSGAIDRDWVGYKEYVGDAAAAVTNAAHDKGVRVVPTFQLFDSKAGYPKMTKFLTNPAAQDRFIAEALDLMAERKADGAGLDFEGVPALNPLGKYYVPFVAKFRDAMKARFPDSTLVNATSAGASERIIKGLVPLVDYQMVMTYNYRSSGSSVTGAIAPLDNATRNVKIHMARILQWAPADHVLLGVPYYGYNWPVTSKVPHATVQSNKKKYGAVKSVTYTSARDFLAAHPKVKRHYDALEGSAYYTYWSKTYKTYRQVYFEDEHSLAAKYDYVLTSGLGGIGIWTLDNDRGLRRALERPARQVLRADPRGEGEWQGRDDHALEWRGVRQRARLGPGDRDRAGARLVEMDHPRHDRQARPLGGVQEADALSGSAREAHRPSPARSRERLAGGHVHAPRAVHPVEEDLAFARDRVPSAVLSAPRTKSLRIIPRNLATSCGPPASHGHAHAHPTDRE